MSRTLLGHGRTGLIMTGPFPGVPYFLLRLAVRLVHEPHCDDGVFVRPFLHGDKSGFPHLLQGTALAVSTAAEFAHAGGTECDLPAEARLIEQEQGHPIGAAFSSYFR